MAPPARAAMPVRLVYSNRTEALVAELGVRVRKQQAERGPLEPVRVVVPSRAIETAVRLGIARDQGIAANLDVVLLTQLARDAAPPGARVADAGALEALVLRLLLDDAALGHAELAPVRAYLAAAGDDRDARDRRRVQLASRLGRLFEEYTYSRGELLVAWREGPALGEARADVERWQRRLWLSLFAPDGLARRAPVPIVPLHEAVAAPATGDDRAPSPLHVFGFAHVARGFHALFARAARRADVVVYALSPCEGFWEDVGPGDPELLALWARPGRDSVRALNALAGFDHDDLFADPTTGRASTVLTRLQADLLRRADPRGTALPVDASLQVLEHASVRRECEAVASAIWQALRDDATLRFDQIEVLVPPSQAGEYVAHLGAALRESHDVPFQIVGVADGSPSHLGEAIDALLALPLGTFTRPELLRLLVHPSVLAAVDDVDPARWVAWCEALGVVHGADHADHEGTYIERDILNWDQGLRRLALGAFMAGDASGDRTAFEADGHGYLPLELAGTELHEAATFGRLVRSLVEDARFARRVELTTAKWAELFAAMFETYLAPTSEAEVDELARAMRQVTTLGDVDLGGARVGYVVASELLRARLSGARVGRGGEGVVVSTLGVARGLPARVVFACGMGEGRFPAPDAEDPLDLRWAERREGDVTARERDKYAFLEVLLGARDRLVLSYVSRDPLTGDALSASSVVQELVHALALRGHDVGALVRRHPLRRWDARYFPSLAGGPAGALGTMELPEARAEAVAAAVRKSAEVRGGRPAAHDVLARAESGDPAWSSLARALGIERLPEAPSFTETRLTVPMFALVKFLEHPLQGWARFRLGLDESDDEDVTARDAEPFETPLRDETLLLREVLLSGAAEGQSVTEAYDVMARERELRGLGPSGVFARGERGAHLDVLDAWRRGLEGHDVTVESLQVHRFGRGGEHARVHQVHGALGIDVAIDDRQGVRRTVRVELAGKSLPVGGAGRVSATLLKRANESKDNEWAVAGRLRTMIRAFVEYAVLVASGVEPGDAHGALALVQTNNGLLQEAATFAPLTVDGATVWLRDLLADLLGAPHAYFLPCEAVFVHHRRGGGPVVPVLQEARDRLAGGGDGGLALRSAYGPVPRTHVHPIPDEETARAMIARRFGPLLAALPQGGAS